MNFLQGKGTYITAVGTIALGIYQCTQKDIANGAQTILLGLGMIFGRRAIANMTPLKK